MGIGNEPLRRAMLRAGHEVASLAEAVEVSPKSVERWLAGTSVPYPRTRYRVAALLGEDESYLWPEVTDRTALARAELVNIWPRRGDVPSHLWDELLRRAERSVDLLAFAGLFLTEEHPQWLETLRAKATEGVYGLLAAHTPTLHLRRVDGAYFHTYVESFERVWSSARPLEPEAEASVS